MADNREVLVLRGTLEGHSGWVTSLATCPTNPDILSSGSRDKTSIVWQLNGDDQAYGVPKKALKGHSHIVSDCKLSLDSEFASSSSWDKTVRLWNLKTGEIIKYAGHTSDVLSVDSSQNLRVIASASRDKTIKLWNIVGEEVATLEGHTDWVTSVRFVPGSASDIISASSDKLVKSWDLNEMKLTADFVGHTGYVTAITVSPDGSLCASAGKDGSIILWDFSVKKVLYTLDAKEEVHAVAFSPNRFWLCAATSKSIKIFHLEKRKPMDESKPEFVSTSTKARDPHCISLAWSADGQNLFSGYTDNVIRVWQVMTSSS